MGPGRRVVGVPIHEVVLRCFRQGRFASRAAFADAIRVTPAYVSSLLSPPGKWSRVPSEAVIKRIADVCGRNPRERGMYLALLMQARMSRAYPSAIPGVPESVMPPREMPKAFIQRLGRDVSQFSERRLREKLRSVTLTYKLVHAVLRGEALFDRWQVAKVAKALGAPVVDYVRLAKLLPADVLLVAEKNPAEITDLSALGRHAFNDLFRRIGKTPKHRGKNVKD